MFRNFPHIKKTDSRSHPFRSFCKPFCKRSIPVLGSDFILHDVALLELDAIEIVHSARSFRPTPIKNAVRNTRNDQRSKDETSGHIQHPLLIGKSLVFLWSGSSFFRSLCAYIIALFPFFRTLFLHKPQITHRVFAPANHLFETTGGGGKAPPFEFQTFHFFIFHLFCFLFCRILSKKVF